ncbi:flagellar assembly protein FliW [Litchfieldia salsa]|uniref:Flagellar assembly factor FliW n=1 Tax=Litchfieldia salsa TaxID=930152 RepID=A0A1H0WWL6_9BACI|nr:flagellar assembly protein FliW [Litchfieldia salsa]SDP95057.1 flagellar assembly factor FliW [Litchfieldia salsa]
MKVNTKYHGEVEVAKEELITFEHGIPGFIDEKSFVLLPFSDDSLFLILQSINTASLGFVLTSPFTFFKEYDIELPEHIVDDLQIKTEQDVVIYSILTVQDPFEKTTANLQAPVIVNTAKNLGKQVILNDTNYTTRHQLIQEKVR